MSSRNVILDNLDFGKRIAEQEEKGLSNYFVKTPEWLDIWEGRVDAVYGPKGSGKSALYTLLVARRDQLFDRGILFVEAENVRGATAFASLAKDKTLSEERFRHLWKLYLLTLVVRAAYEYGVGGPAVRKAREAAEAAGLIPAEFSLSGLLSRVKAYVSRMLNPKDVELGLEVDAASGLPTGVSGKISLGDPTDEEIARGAMSVDAMLRAIDDELEEDDIQIWVGIDRLDVAFGDSVEMEGRALRALFRVFVDFKGLSAMSLKVFLRDDIWERILVEGFREASHVEPSLTLAWSNDALLNLAVRRLLKSAIVRVQLGVRLEEVLESSSKQREVFHTVFPVQIDSGEKNPDCFGWILNHAKDGGGGSTPQALPREVIHFLNESVREQRKLKAVGKASEADRPIIERAAVRSAWPQVSKARYERTLVAEYPLVKEWTEALREEKTKQFPESLAQLWGVDEVEARRRAQILVDLGFFKREGTKEEPEYWVPFLYRKCLGMIQGSAGLE